MKKFLVKWKSESSFLETKSLESFRAVFKKAVFKRVGGIGLGVFWALILIFSGIFEKLRSKIRKFSYNNASCENFGA